MNKLLSMDLINHILSFRPTHPIAVLIKNDYAECSESKDYYCNEHLRFKRMVKEEHKRWIKRMEEENEYMQQNFKTDKKIDNYVGYCEYYAYR